MPEIFLVAQITPEDSKKPVVQHSELPQDNSFKTSSDERWETSRLSAAAELLRHQQGVVAVDLQQVEQEEPVSVRI